MASLERVSIHQITVGDLIEVTDHGEDLAEVEAVTIGSSGRPEFALNYHRLSPSGGGEAILSETFTPPADHIRRVMTQN